MKRILIAGIIILLISRSYALVHSYEQKPTAIANLTFSNTQTWNPDFFNTTINPSAFTVQALERIHVPPPPANESEETKQELKALHEMVALRTPEKLAEINDELSIRTTHFGSSTIGELADKQTRPYTAALVDRTSELAAPILFSIKKHYDRVRPSYLDPTLTTAIDVPLHPAYPNAHSIQSMLLALLMSKLDPTNEAVYMAAADRIAHNREIAGLHYPSDAKAGQEIARQLFPILFEDPTYAELFEQAQQEWH